MNLIQYILERKRLGKEKYTYQKLSSVLPSLKTTAALTKGRMTWFKGFDILHLKISEIIAEIKSTVYRRLDHDTQAAYAFLKVWLVRVK